MNFGDGKEYPETYKGLLRAFYFLIYEMKINNGIDTWYELEVHYFGLVVGGEPVLIFDDVNKTLQYTQENGTVDYKVVPITSVTFGDWIKKVPKFYVRCNYHPSPLDPERMECWNMICSRDLKGFGPVDFIIHKPKVMKAIYNNERDYWKLEESGES